MFNCIKIFKLLFQIKLSSYTYICPSAKILGNVFFYLGEHSILGPNFTVYTFNHNYNADFLPYGFDDHIYEITVGENVWIGGNVIITKAVVIGAGSVITKDVAPGANPAKIIKNRDMEVYKTLKMQKRFYLEEKMKKTEGLNGLLIILG